MSLESAIQSISPDLDALAKARIHLATVEPRFAPLIEKYGPCVLPSGGVASTVYETLSTVIFSQQLSTKAARTILNRFKALYTDCDFPAPHQVRSATVEDLRAVGCSRPKAAYLIELANRSEELPSMEDLMHLPEEEIIEKLTVFKGIGRWSVEMLLMFDLGRLDVLPVDDLGIQNAFVKFFALDTKPKKKEMVALAESWAPYRSVASWYLWRSLENTPVV